MGLSPKKRRAIAAYADGGAVWPLVDPGWLRSPLTLTRAQLAGVQSSAIGADGATLGLFGADTARFAGTARRLLIEGQRTNALTNPRAEGAVTGSPGTLPTGWGGFAAGLTRTIVGTGTTAGVQWVDVRWNGTAAATFLNLDFLGAQIAAAVNGQSWAISVSVAVVGGSLANVTALFTRMRVNDASGNYLADLSVPNVLSQLGGSLTRLSASGTIATASTAFIVPYLQMTWANGAAIDFTLRIGFPQLEQGAFASSAILPPVGTPGASTRGADLVSASLSSLGIGANGACTVLWSGVIPQQSPNNQFIFELSDDSFNNRYTLANSNNTSNIVLSRVTSNVFQGAANVLGIMTAGTPFRVGMSIDSAGRAAATFNTNPVQTVTGGPTSGLLRFRLGSDPLSLAANQLFGETLALRVLPYTLSDTDLAAAVAALPT